MAATLLKASEVTELGFGSSLKLAEAKLQEGAGALTISAISATEGNNIEFTGWDRALLLIENSAAAEKELTVTAGESPPALRKGIAVTKVKLAEKTVSVMMIESAQSLSTTGLVKLTWSSGTTGKIAVLVLKK